MDWIYDEGIFCLKWGRRKWYLGSFELNRRNGPGPGGPGERVGDLESVRKYYRVDRREIYFLQFVLEASDGIATLSTIDPGLGLVALFISPGCVADVESILSDLKKNGMLIFETEGLSSFP